MQRSVLVGFMGATLLAGVRRVRTTHRHRTLHGERHLLRPGNTGKSCPGAAAGPG